MKKLHVADINKKATEKYLKIENVKVFNEFEFVFKEEVYDLSFTCDVLIHIHQIGLSIFMKSFIKRVKDIF